MSTIPYQQIISHLQSPRRIIVDPLRRDCNPPEDPNWPTPHALEEVEELMKRLPHWAQVACAITAAEMVFPIWEEWAEGIEDLPIEHRDAPRRAIETAWQWLEEETSETNVARRVDLAYAADTAADADAAAAYAAYAADAGPAYVAYAAAGAAYAAYAAADADPRAASWAARTASWTARAARAARAAWAAAYPTAWGVVSFYNEWWQLCRCRLAFILEVRG